MVPLKTKIFVTFVAQLLGATLALALATSRLQVKVNVAWLEVQMPGASVFNSTQKLAPVPLVSLSDQLSLTVSAVAPGAKVMVRCELTLLSLCSHS